MHRDPSSILLFQEIQGRVDPLMEIGLNQTDVVCSREGAQIHDDLLDPFCALLTTGNEPSQCLQSIIESGRLSLFIPTPTGPSSRFIKDSIGFDDPGEAPDVFLDELEITMNEADRVIELM